MKSPFKFLDSYTKEDCEIFFGREREIEELYHRVFESTIMLVYGVSGTGKSSLINCGLANKFSETDWLPLMIRRSGNMIESLASAINTASITKQTYECITPAQFRKAVKSLYLDHYKPVYFIFDQFEELFLFGNKEEKREVVQVIKALVESGIQCRFIFVMREEYMAGITEFEKYIPTIFSNRVRIEKMAHTNALEAIIGPCKVANIDLEEGFAEALLEKLSPESADVELTYLQVFLDKIYRLAEINRKESSSELSFTQNLIHKTGNVSDLLGSFLEEQLKGLDEPDTGLTILKSFVSLKGTKRQLSENEIIESCRTFGKDLSGAIISKYLLKFVNIRILHDKDDNGKYELRHDSLATKIYEKITIVEKEMLEICHFLENALISYHKRKVLLTLNDLKYLAPYEDRLFVNKETHNLIEVSKKEINKGKKRLKRAAIAGFVSILIISLAAFMKIYHWPLNGTIRWLGYSIYIIWFLPLFVFYVLKTRENRTVNFLFLIFTLVFLGYIYFYDIGVHSSISSVLMKPQIQTDRQLKRIIGSYNHKIDSTHNLISKITDGNTNILNEYKKNTGNLLVRTSEVYEYIRDLKVYITKIVEGPDIVLTDNDDISISSLKRPSDSNIPQEIMIGDYNIGKAHQLKVLLNDYKEYLVTISDNDSNLNGIINRVLNLDNKFHDPDIDGSLESWEANNFQSKGLGFVLITLTQIQLDIKYCESEVMTYLYNKMLAENEHKSK
ncbi:MAG TPA: hypothetical protein VMV47_08595 [Bacteroidales bacterium]|nr:hypothetical protein [Bacteroidales bacterium]